MNLMMRSALAAALVSALATPAAAGELRLSMTNGLVTLVAKDVTVREILAEWSRIGDTRIVNAEKLTGGPVTLELTDVPEGKALDTVLRSAAGYVMAPRMAGTTGASMYDRILILASSRAPVVAANPAPFTNRPMNQMPQMPQNVAPDDDAEFAPTAGPVPMNMPVSGQAFPGMAPQPQPQGPLTAPRPGMLPTPATTQPVGNPYLGTPPGQNSPVFNPMPAPVPNPPRVPGGPGGRP